MPTKHIPDPAWRKIIEQENGDHDAALERVKKAVRDEADELEALLNE
jgi:hypothetical protein